MKILVTGGAGFIGSHLVDACVAVGDQVVIADSLAPEVHPTGRVPSYVNQNAEFLHGNVADEEFIRNAVDGVDVVFHCAARLGIQQSFKEAPTFVHDNVLGTATLLQAAAAAGVRKMVISSSMGVYGEGMYSCIDHVAVHPSPRTRRQLADGHWEQRCPACQAPMQSMPTPETTPIDPTSIYSLTKYDQEALALQMAQAGVLNSMSVSVLRYFNAYGPRQALSNPYSGVGAIFAAAFMANEWVTLYEDGQQTRDFVYVSDIVKANQLAMHSKDSWIVNIGTGKGTTVEALAVAFAHALGAKDRAKIPYIGRVGDIRHSVADISLAKAVLGYEPSVSLDQGVLATVDWLRTTHEQV